MAALLLNAYGGSLWIHNICTYIRTEELSTKVLIHPRVYVQTIYCEDQQCKKISFLVKCLHQTIANRNDDHLFAVFHLLAGFSLVTFGEISSKLAVL